MATPTQQFGGNTYPTPGSQGSSAPPSAYPTERGGPPASAAQYQQQQQQQQQASAAPAANSFDKFVVIHIATTCDEHGVYVTKDSAEVIEIGWVVVDAQNPEREVRALSVSGRISSVKRGTTRRGC